MSIQSEIDATPDGPQTAREKFQEWIAQPASVTNGHLLVSRFVWTFFLAISAVVGYQQLKLDNQRTRDQIAAAIVREADNCAERNARRDAAGALAVEVLTADQASLNRDQKTLDNDNANWTTIDGLFEGGIPEPARTTIFQGLVARQETIDDDQEALDARVSSIETTYALEPCSPTVNPAGDTPVDE